jgi:hypothetical protein
MDNFELIDSGTKIIIVQTKETRILRRSGIIGSGFIAFSVLAALLLFFCIPENRTKTVKLPVDTLVCV